VKYIAFNKTEEEFGLIKETIHFISDMIHKPFFFNNLIYFQVKAALLASVA